MKRVPLPSDVVTEVLNASPDATIISDGKGRILIANQAAEAMFGYEADELIGEMVEILVPEAMRAKHEELRSGFQEAPRGRPMVSGLEIYGRHKNGKSFRAEVGLSPIETDDGLIITSTIRVSREAEDSEA